MTFSSSLSHDDVQSFLPEYAHALITSEHRNEEYALLISHLETCTDCQQELAILVDAAVTLYDGVLTLDPAPSLVQQGLRIFIQFSEVLLDALRPRQMLAAFRDTDDPRGQMRYSYFYKLPDEQAPEVTIEIYDDRSTAEFAVVDVFIQMPWRSPVEQAGTNVILQMPSSELKGTTDDCGYVSFPAVPRHVLSTMKVEITA